MVGWCLARLAARPGLRGCLGRGGEEGEREGDGVDVELVVMEMIWVVEVIDCGIDGDCEWWCDGGPLEMGMVTSVGCQRGEDGGSWRGGM